MSTAAHEPRRVSPRRAASPSDSKVTPRRNAPEPSEPTEIQYDSEEVPVLIRLPNLRDLERAEGQRSSRGEKKRHRVDRSSSASKRRSSRTESKASKKTFGQQAGGNKMVLGGVVGGILLVATLFLLNGGGPEPTLDQDGWANESDGPELLANDLEISIPSANEPPPLYPGFAYEATDTETAQFAGGALEQAPIGAPLYNEPAAPGQPGGLAMPSQPQGATEWPSAETMGLPSDSLSTSSDLWPSENLSLEQGGSPYPSTNAPSQIDDRSSMYPSETESHRVGRLNPNRPPSTPYNRGSSILDGNIETPDTTSMR